MDLEKTIRDIPDFPKKGILFKDITTLLQNGEALKTTIEKFKTEFKDKNIDKIVGIESRGFIFGTALAYALGIGFIPVRKKGKLPSKTHCIEYELEYGTDILEIHTDAIKEGERVLIIDDLLATGGTAKATAELINKCKGNIVSFAFLIELSFLNGKEKIKDYNVFNLITY